MPTLVAATFALADRNYAQWADLIAFRPDASLTHYPIQPLAEAHGKVNLDYFSVIIERLPIGENNEPLAPEELLSEVRLNLDEFTNDLATFSPFTTADAAKWNSSSPLGAVIHIDLQTEVTVAPMSMSSVPMHTGKVPVNLEDAAVVVSRSDPTHWTFSTIDTPWGDWEHPVSGHREFGIERRPDGRYVLYTRGVDRPTGWLDSWMQNLVFASGDKVWKTVMERVSADIIRRKGEAKVGETRTERDDWDEFLGAQKEPTNTPLRDWLNLHDQMESHRRIEREHREQQQQIDREMREIMRRDHERLLEIQHLQGNLDRLESQGRMQADDHQRRDLWTAEQARLHHERHQAELEIGRLGDQTRQAGELSRNAAEQFHRGQEDQRRMNEQMRDHALDHVRHTIDAPPLR